MNEITNKKRVFRPLEDLNLIDNFLFSTLMTQGEDGEEFCRILLSTILGKKIRKVKVNAQQRILGFDTNKHGIQLDAYVEDVSDIPQLPGCEMSDAEIIPDIYDIEPNNTYEKETLPKRMRYYHGLIDTKHLNTGIDYAKLPRVVIIVILPYDPFNQNRMVYTIKNHCVEVPGMTYEDGAEKIFLYTKGKADNASNSLSDMLKYIQDTKEENITNEDIHTIHKFVERAKHRKEVGVQYMRLWEENEKLIKDALAEGRAEGLALGHAEGHALGHAEGHALGHAEGHAEALTKGIQILVTTYQELNQGKDAALQALMDKFALSHEEAEHAVNKYWS